MSRSDFYVEKNLQTERSELNNLEKLIHSIERYISKNTLLMQEIVKARTYYQEKTGKIKENYIDYENKTNAFLYWFIFDWPCVTLNMDTPIQAFLHTHTGKLSAKETDAYRKMVAHYHSIFEFVKVGKKETVIYDLFRRKKWRVPDTKALIGFERGCFFEARVIPVFNQLMFAPYIILYPFKVSRVIKKQIKLLKNDPEKMKTLILRLEYLNFKQNTYSQFDVEKIYVF